MTFRKIHKISGILAGVVLFLLAFTGFFLNHDNWDFLYNTKVPNAFIPASVIDEGNRLNEVFLIDKDEENHLISAGLRGIFVCNDRGEKYTKTLSLRCYSIRRDTSTNNYYAATSDGIYLSKDKGNTWVPFALRNKVVNALSLHNNKLFASINKSVVVLINSKGEVLLERPVYIPATQLKEKISLSRFIRDLHYGRGLFDNGWSLLINDISALFLSFLAISGYLIWYFIRQIKYKKKNRAGQIKLFIRLHSTIMSLLVVIPLVLLTLTGIVLDHPGFFSPLLRNISISSNHLPPVYHSLKEDIWSVDISKDIYRIGNRYGVYKSDDLDSWELESRGFAYRMKRVDNQLYVTGMGAPNRLNDKNGNWHILINTPHMFKDVNLVKNRPVYFNFRKPDIPLPELQTTTLYTILSALHNGKFFAPWWVYVNDGASLFLFMLFTSGTIRWYRKKNKIIPKLSDS